MGLFLFWRVFHPTFFVKKEAGSSKVKNQMKNTYSFYDKYMTIKNSKDDIKLSYYKLYNVFETENYFYLYINKNYSFVLAKDTFSIGNPNEFYKFMKKKLWYKI
ncbi:MAG: YcxB family protein [Clostridia bacterium]|nr:YcxB family protein [Clostridia bacterium]